MQYADIALAVRTGRHASIYTYAIPPELLVGIAQGVFVEVPLGKRFATGIITRLRAQLPEQRLRGKLRPIRRLLSAWPLLTSEELAFRQEIAARSLSPEHLFATLGLPTATILKKIVPPMPIRVASASRRCKSPIALLEGPGEPRARAISIITKQLERGLPVLLLTPTHETVQLWLNDLKAAGVNAAFPATNPQRVADELAVWQTVLRGGPRVVVGTRAAVWLPFRELGTIVIDQPTHHQFEEEQAPFYDTFHIALARHQLMGGDLLVRDSLPPLLVFADSQKKHWRFAPPPPLPTVEILPRAATWLSARTEARVEAALEEHKRVLFVVNQAGWARGLVCGDCGRLARCERCTTLLSLTSATSAPFCRVCNTHQLAERCAQCGSASLKPFGWGSERWAETLTDHYHQANVLDLSQSPIHLGTASARRVASASGRSQSPPQWDIALLRPAWLEMPPIRADVVVAIEPERLLFGTDFAAEERWLRFLLQLRAATHGNLLIETRLGASDFLQELSSPLPKNSLVTMLHQRRDHHYPPYGRLVTISCPIARQDELVQFRNEQTRLGHIEAVGPAPINDRQVQLRLKLSHQSDLTQLRKALASLDAKYVIKLVSH